MTEYKIDLSLLSSSDSFTEASKEELRVLLTIAANKGRVESDEALANAACVSRGRAASALVFWEEAGVITEGEATDTSDTPTITEEFEEQITLGRITDTTAREVARDIRDNDLAALISECATLMNKAALSTEEVKIIAALYTQYALGEEYIITLAAFISEKGKLTAVRLGTEAERLVKRGITTIEDLESYIEDRANESGAEWEFRHLIGIYNRNLTKGEQEYVRKWYYDFGYGEDVIGEAYDITVLNTSRLSLPYMDKLLTHWNESGCKTLEECRRLIESERAKKEIEEHKKTPPKMPRAQKTTPRYGDFDVDDAFKKALLRSYGDPDLVEEIIKMEKEQNSK